jgi:ElaB/YqjD/DUF883 family membrane-anchored ribosome-binding protein
MANIGDTRQNGDDVAQGARDALGNVVREVKNLRSSLIDDAKTTTGKVAKIVDKNGRAALSNLQHTVQEKPALSVGIAVGAGVLLGMLFSSRR